MKATSEFLYSSRLFVILSLFLFSMIIALTVAQVRQQQDLRSSAAAGNCSAGSIGNDTEEKKAENLINKFRKDSNLEPLKFHDDLNRAAAWQSEDMAKTQKLSHKDSSGRDVGERIADCGYQPFTEVKENITDVAVTGQEAFNAWKNSPPHREAMLCKDCRDIGLARVEAGGSKAQGGKNKGKGKNKGRNKQKVWYWTMTAGALQNTKPTEKPTATPTLASATNTPTPPSEATNTPSPTQIAGDPTALVTAPPPSGTLRPSDTGVQLTISIPGIGKNGNANPKRPTRPVMVTVTDKNNKNMAEAAGTVTYNSSSGVFSGTVGLPAKLPSGSYLIKVKTDNSITRIVSAGFLTVENGKVNKLPEVTLPAVDLDKNNEISFADIIVFRNCVLKNNCSGQMFDLNDDGKINAVLDFNVFFEVFGNYQGE